jgi:hypothetical protein
MPDLLWRSHGQDRSQADSGGHEVMTDSPLILRHVAACRYIATGHTDPAKRVSDIVTLHWIAGGWDACVGKWIAFKLSDGTSDDTLYPSKYDAVRHQKGVYQHYMYLRLVAGGMNVCEAESLLALHRRARERDIAKPDIDARNGGRDLIPRITVEDRNRQLRELGGQP